MDRWPFSGGTVVCVHFDRVPSAKPARDSHALRLEPAFLCLHVYVLWTSSYQLRVILSPISCHGVSTGFWPMDRDLTNHLVYYTQSVGLYDGACDSNGESSTASTDTSVSVVRYLTNPCKPSLCILPLFLCSVN